MITGETRQVFDSRVDLGLMSLEGSGAEETIELLRESQKACKRAQGLTQQLLTFARGGEPVKAVLSIEEILRENILFALRGSNVRSELKIDQGLWSVEADSGQISQVVQNLVINADQAMPEGGRVQVEAMNSADDGCGDLPLKSGPYVKVMISDEGHGIPSSSILKIFDPYFTTKQRGSGLGLATCFSIVRKHQGCLTVSSTLGEGSQFVFYLPARPEERSISEKRREIAQGQGRVLLMDDEESIRLVASRMFGRLGYQVDLAADGEEAVAMYIDAFRGECSYSAVVLDLTIPGGMGGCRCLEALLEIDPEVKAIVSSGYSTDPVMAQFREHGFSGVLSKPFNLVQAAEVLEWVVGQCSGEETPEPR